VAIGLQAGLQANAGAACRPLLLIAAAVLG
jgi:hypothetical protein